ncbi:P22 phage major capsid protein family protein, partial [Acinetobacter baumannii]
GIKVPTAGRVYNGAVYAEGGAGSDVLEQEVSLTLDTQKHVGLKFGAKEKLLDITDFKERILRPQIVTLSSVVEADLISKGIKGTSNVVTMPANTPSQGLALARGKLNQYLAPPSDRTSLINSPANIALSSEVSKMFNPKVESDKAYLEGYIGRAYNSDVYEHQSIGVHTNGTATGITVSTTAGQTGGSITMVASTAGTVTKGTIITIAGVFAVHPLTGANTGVLQQFVVTEDTSLNATAAPVKIYPEIITAQPGQTVTAAPAASAAVTVVSTNGAQNLMFQKDAFTAAFAPLPVLASCEGYTARLPNGMSVRVMTFGDGLNDLERTRIDVLYGFTVVRGIHSCRIFQAP